MQREKKKELFMTDMNAKMFYFLSNYQKDGKKLD